MFKQINIYLKKKSYHKNTTCNRKKIKMAAMGFQQFKMYFVDLVDLV